MLNLSSKFAFTPKNGVFKNSNNITNSNNSETNVTIVVNCDNLQDIGNLAETFAQRIMNNFTRNDFVSDNCLEKIAKLLVYNTNGKPVLSVSDYSRGVFKFKSNNELRTDNLESIKMTIDPVIDTMKWLHAAYAMNSAAETYGKDSDRYDFIQKNTMEALKRLNLNSKSNEFEQAVTKYAPRYGSTVSPPTTIYNADTDITLKNALAKFTSLIDNKNELYEGAYNLQNHADHMHFVVKRLAIFRPNPKRMIKVLIKDLKYQRLKIDLLKNCFLSYFSTDQAATMVQYSSVKKSYLTFTESRELTNYSDIKTLWQMLKREIDLEFTSWSQNETSAVIFDFNPDEVGHSTRNMEIQTETYKSKLQSAKEWVDDCFCVIEKDSSRRAKVEHQIQIALTSKQFEMHFEM